MFGASKLKYLIAGLGLIGFAATVSPASAATVQLTVVDTGVTVGTNTKLFRADIGPSGLSSVNRLTLTDDGTIVGGAQGIFSGFDLDAFFIDLDGNFATAGDRISPLGAGSTIAFTAGTTRPIVGNHPEWQPTVAHPGPVYGTTNATTLQLATATLDTFDANAIANVFQASGFFTFGDGGELIWTFSDLFLAANPNMTLFFGEVAGQAGENLLVSVSSVPLPGAVWLFLSAIAVLFGMSRRRNTVAA
jgi:hypothetical protein